MNHEILALMNNASGILLATKNLQSGIVGFDKKFECVSIEKVEINADLVYTVYMLDQRGGLNTMVLSLKDWSPIYKGRL